MKKLLTTISALILFVSISNAQIDIKANPIGLIFRQPDISLEFLANEQFGIEVSGGLLYGNVPLSGIILGNEGKLKQRGFNIRIGGKYYFMPVLGGDGFFAGGYLGASRTVVSGSAAFWGYDPGYKQTGLSLGGFAGYKYILDSGFFFEAQIGRGFNFGSNSTYNDPVLNTNEISRLRVSSIRTVAVGFRFDFGKSGKKKK